MAKKFFHGQDTVAYFKAATALGAVAVPVAGDALRILSATITPEQDRTQGYGRKGPPDLRSRRLRAVGGPGWRLTP